MWFMFVSSCFYVSYRAFGGTPGGSAIKNLPVNEKDADSIPGLGIFPGEGNGNPLLYSCLGNSKDRGACRLQSMESKRVTDGT